MTNRLKNKDFTNFDYGNITLGQPTVQTSSQGFFSRIYNNGEPLFIQTNETLTKSGISNSKKPYTDLMLPGDDSIVIDFLENLESHIIQLIYNKRELWFHNPIDLDDIENSFISCFRLFKGGKFYLIRSYFNLINDTFNIFNEHNERINQNEITDKSKIISILEIQGVRFTQKSFKLDVINKQILVLDQKNEFSTCMIKNLGKKEIQESNSTEYLGETTSSTQNLQNELSNNFKNLDELNNSEDTNNEYEILDNDDYKNLEKNNDNENVENKLNKETTNNEMQEPGVKFDQNITTELNEDDNKNNEQIEINEQLDNVNENEENEIRDVENSNTDLEITNTNNLEIQEIKNLNLDEGESISLKKPNDVYKEIYKLALQKARTLKQNAIEAYLEAKNIKNTHLLDFSDLSEDSDSDMDFD